ncbi:MAG TPA: TIGR02117 family protein [Allosphingosinicella sp.]|jgi:uncharacterized protein (TIGR02117 family)
MAKQAASIGKWRARAFWTLLAAATLLAAVPLLILNAAVFLGAVPFNPGWEEAEAGEPGAVTVYIRTNGVHTWIVVPKVHGRIDWRPFAPGAHLADPRYGAASHVGFGYGNREFYLNTPSWADLTFSRAIGAFSGGGRSLLHVEHIHDPRPDSWQRPIVLRADEYARLSEFLVRRFQRDAAGRTMPVLGRGYGANDMFYEANGGYSLYLTCNEWTGRALRGAGVRTGLWTPFSESIMWRLN